jgi:hypothetical protein
MNDLTTKRTSLSTSTNVVDTLNWKRKQLIEDDKMVAEGLSDYVGLSVNEITSQIDYLKEAKAEITKREKQLKEQKEAILEGTAYFMQDAGIDRLEGIFVSSITLTKAKDDTTKEVFKLIVPKKESEQFLLDAGLAVMEKVEVPATKTKAKINNRKIVVGEVLEEKNKRDCYKNAMVKS